MLRKQLFIIIIKIKSLDILECIICWLTIFDWSYVCIIILTNRRCVETSIHVCIAELCCLHTYSIHYISRPKHAQEVSILELLFRYQVKENMQACRILLNHFVQFYLDKKKVNSHISYFKEINDQEIVEESTSMEGCWEGKCQFIT